MEFKERGQNGLKFEYSLFGTEVRGHVYHSTLSNIILLNDFWKMVDGLNQSNASPSPSLQFWTDLNTVFCYFLKLLLATSSSRPPSIGTENFKQFGRRCWMHPSIKNRLSSLGLESWDMGGGGDCFFHCLVPLVGMTVPVPRRCVAQHERQWTHIWRPWWFWTLWGISELLRFGSNMWSIRWRQCWNRCRRRLYFATHPDIRCRFKSSCLYIRRGYWLGGACASRCRRKSPHHCSLCHTTHLYTCTRILDHPCCAPKKQSVPALKRFVDRMRMRRISWSVHVQKWSCELNL